jgi:hypothetical protein
MKISEILEARLKNTGHTFDAIRGISEEARDIRQIYNFCLKNKLTPSKKSNIVIWATYIKGVDAIRQNADLINMLDEIIRICS